MKYEAVIGLEVHIQVRTASKMFCSCPNRFGAEPNTLICPVCMGYPGTLPVPNHEAIRKAVVAGLLTGCEIAHFSKFDRKSYFYPDLVKTTRSASTTSRSAGGEAADRRDRILRRAASGEVDRHHPDPS